MTIFLSLPREPVRGLIMTVHIMGSKIKAS